MGAKAARAALENSGVAAEEIDLILAASVSGESISPSVSVHDSESAGAFLHDHGYQCGMLCVLIFFWNGGRVLLPEAR